jgi:outer membrane protein OmpA-like peptidoglycan-associated protein
LKVTANAASTEIEIAQAEGAEVSENAGNIGEGKHKKLCADETKPPCAEVAPESTNSGTNSTTPTGASTGNTEVATTPSDTPVETKADPVTDAATAIAPANTQAESSADVTTEQPPIEAQTVVQVPREDSDAASGTPVGEEQQAPVGAVQSDQAPGQKKKTKKSDSSEPVQVVPESGGSATVAEQHAADSDAPAGGQSEPSAVEAQQPADPATSVETPAAAEESKPESAVFETSSDRSTPVNAATPTDTATGDASPDATQTEIKPESNVETAEQPTTTPTTEASRTKRNKQRPELPAAAATNEQAEPVETTTETVTEETTRTSSEDVVEARVERSDNENDSNDLIKILGAAAGGVVVGALLNEAFNDGGTVVENTGDRIVIERDGEYYVRKDENEILRRPGSDVRTETFRDGSSRTIVDRANGVSVVTVRDADGYVVRRVRILPDGQRIVLFDDTGSVRDSRSSFDSRRSSWIEEDQLPRFDPTFVPQHRYVDYRNTDRRGLRDVLMARPVATIDRSYTLRQVREDWRLRDAMPRLDLDAVSFNLGSAAIATDQVHKLDSLGWAMKDILDQNPDEVFLIEGHTDAVGSRISNLVLSDRRAEAVALALAEYYAIPPENLITQGYGEEFLKIATQAPERANRRATVRRITPLLETMVQLK